MNRDEQEMALWVSVYEHWFPCHGYEPEECGNIADAAVAEFRKRYPPQAQAPKAVWYDEPPFAGEYHVEGLPCVCWVDEDVVYHPSWDSAGERPRLVEVPLAGRRVSPIVKPPEPKT